MGYSAEDWSRLQACRTDFGEFVRHVFGGGDVAGCSKCGRKMAPKGMQITRRYASERGFCVCNIPPGVVLTDVEGRWTVYAMLHDLGNPVHDWCGEAGCEVCKR